jgi:hypothetical protein
MKPRFLFRVMSAFPLAVTILVCTQNAVAQTITDVYLAGGRTNFSSATCPATAEIRLEWKIVSKGGGVGIVIYQLMNSDEAVFSAPASVVIDRENSVIVMTSSNRVAPGRWQDTVSLHILTPVRVSSLPSD